ncbi:restriction endonuclease subunit S [Thalassospira alkalitolerans]|uniref:restriction endonuclease subunit S n=1 Tax=Thalassospira alkalitolerans TaxID=1293890 RepID=UPI003AA849B4
MEQVLYQLPDGWEWKRIEDVFTIASGESPTKKDMQDGGAFPVYGGNGEAGRYNDFNLDGPNIVIGRFGRNCGSVRLVNEKIWVSSGAFFIKEYKVEILEDYLAKILSALDLSASANKTTQPVISYKAIKELYIPYPPLNEQKRIAEKLDALLTRIDTIIPHLQESVTLADALFSSALLRVFNPSNAAVDFRGDYDLPECWDWKSINNISKKVQYGHAYKSGAKGNARLLRITDIRDNKIDWFSVPFVDLSEKELGKYVLCENDILFARVGSTVGKSILIKNPPENAVFASYLIRIVPDLEMILPEYLDLFFQSPAYWSIVRENATGVSQPNINGAKLGEFKIPTPNLEIQKRIVNEMSSLNARVTVVKKELKNKLSLLETAKLSILDLAFKGGL